MNSVVNIAAYKFAELSELGSLRVELKQLCSAQSLRGTILISQEGINLFVAGSRSGIDTLLQRVRSIPELADIEVKESLSSELPFNRMLVKIKREIIAFGIESIDPRRYASKRLSAEELKVWLDEGRPVTLLDTRNDFEVKAGTFKNALPIGVDDFRSFPQAVQDLPEDLKDRPIVTFCTGGIRCEKAAPFMEQAGFKNVYQLDGGILKYFEQCGGEHYEGDCFVFDKRVALNAELAESNLALCFVCQTILSPAEQASPQFEEGVSCPHCYQPKSEQQLEQMQHHQLCIQQATSPLPGSQPYDNVRPISVPQKFAGLELLDFLDAMHTHYTRDDWQHSCAAGELICQGEVIQPGRTMKAGERILHTMPATLEPDVSAEIKLLYEDDALVIVSKPAPLPMHACGRFNRNTLSYILDQAFQPHYLRIIHRLDADTSGVVVLAKSRHIAKLLQPQFVSGSVEKVYLAKVAGNGEQDEFQCDTPLQDAPGPGGVRLPDENGSSASTRFRVLETAEDGTSLLEAIPLTGRTNQIRAHLWSLGLPIQGDPIYLPEGKLGPSRSLSLSDPPLCLHAASITFTHPMTQERMRFSSPDPSWGEIE